MISRWKALRRRFKMAIAFGTAWAVLGIVVVVLTIIADEEASVREIFQTFAFVGLGPVTLIALWTSISAQDQADAARRQADAAELQAVAARAQAGAAAAQASAAGEQARIAQEQLASSQQYGTARLEVARTEAEAAGEQARIAQEQLDSSQLQGDRALQGILDGRFHQGAEALGHDSMSVRLGGVHALAKLKSEAFGQYGDQLIQLLCAFVRNPPVRPAESAQAHGLREDVQEAVRSLAEIPDGASVEPGKVDLRGADLRHLELRGGDLSGAILDAADLSEADLQDVRLNGASLNSARLFGAMLTRVDFTGATTDGARTGGANGDDCTGGDFLGPSQ